MKKWLIGIAAALAAAGILAGCSERAKDVALNEMKVEDYVTLGDYKNMVVDVPDAAVSDEDWNQLLLAVYQGYVTSESDGITDRPVKDGDTVNIDYVGTKDGVAFSGGTDSGYNLNIGSGSFIPGFEEGLVGAMPKETIELDLTFPANYGNVELAGQQVVFTVTVNYILPGLEEMKDSVVAAQKLNGVTNVQELRQYVYDYLAESAEQKRLYSLQNAIIGELERISTVAELPEIFVEKYRQLCRDSIERIAQSNNTTADAYTNYYFRMNSEDYAFLYGEIQARQELILQAIANEQELKVSDEELETLMNNYALETGYDSVEDLQADIPREQLRNYFMSERVMDYLVKNTKTTSSGADR